MGGIGSSLAAIPRKVVVCIINQVFKYLKTYLKSKSGLSPLFALRSEVRY